MSRIPKNPVGFTKGKGIKVELFMDFLCPFSKKAFKTLQKIDQIQLTLIPYLQPWHPTTFYVLSAAVTVYQISGIDTFFKFADILFDHQEEFSDSAVFNKTPKEIYSQLQRISDSIGIQKEEFEKRMISDQTTLDIKILQKYGRQNSVHVTPTFAINGIITDEVGSSFTEEQWLKFLEKLQ